MSSSADLTLRIEHSSSTSTLVVPTPVAVDQQQPTLASIRTERGLDRVARGEATVFRDEWLAIEDKLNRRDDKFYIEDTNGTDLFGGRFDDEQIRGTTVSVLLDSFERDALDIEPEVSFSRTATSDDTIASDIINLMPSPLTVGTTDQTTSSLDFSTDQKPPGEMLRDLASTTGADVRYQADGTVDYLDGRGSISDETLSPSSGALIGEPRIRETSRGSATDVRVISQSNPSTFADSSVTASGREVYFVDEIDSTNTSRLQQRADTLSNEIANAERYLEIECGVDLAAVSDVPEVGDEYPLLIPAYDIGAELQVIERVRVIDADGNRLDRVLFANRTETLQGR